MEKEKLITKKDKIYMLIITLIYAIVSFINLGSFTNPQTFWVSNSNEDSAVIEVSDDVKISYIRYFSGNLSGDYSLSFSYDNVDYYNAKDLQETSAYHWDDSKRVNASYKYIKLTAKKAGTYIGEVGVYNTNNELVQVSAVTENAKDLVDEQNTIPKLISYINSSYFDEIYFPRTAYEHLHGLHAYEWTHPPLGKLIMASSIAVFGMTPFAYRLLGNIAGILMIPTIYIFAKMMFKKTKYGVFAALIMALDGMHFVQTRMGTTDGLLVLFIMLEYLFMYKYVSNVDYPLRKRLFSLFFSGLFMGLAIAIKWTGVFAGIGLAIIFFTSLIIEIVKKKKWQKDNTIIVLCCVVFFIIIPLAIYVLSYIPFFITDPPEITGFKSFIDWQIKMFHYHNDLQATHAYSSEWYTWPLTLKDLLLWTGTNETGLVGRIVLLGNPIIFWVSVPCMIGTLILGCTRKDKFKYWFLIIAILAAMLPYLKIHRVMFLYHYFPVLPFAMLCIIAFAEWLGKKIHSDVPMVIFLILALIMFIIFFPIYSGMYVSNVYLQALRWLPGWRW